MPRLINLTIDELDVILGYLSMDAQPNEKLFFKLNDYKIKKQEEENEYE